MRKDAGTGKELTLAMGMAKYFLKAREWLLITWESNSLLYSTLNVYKGGANE
jgi:hypothetical protein